MRIHLLPAEHCIVSSKITVLVWLKLPVFITFQFLFIISLVSKVKKKELGLARHSGIRDMGPLQRNNDLGP